MSEDVEKWKKRLNRKGPFYLYAQEPYHREYDRGDGTKLVHDGTSYTVIWQDGDKTRIGVLRDWMLCRYGIGTRAALIGDRPQDVWNGHKLDDGEVQAMMAVRNGKSSLPTFDLNMLQNIAW